MGWKSGRSLKEVWAFQRRMIKACQSDLDFRLWACSCGLTLWNCTFPEWYLHSKGMFTQTVIFWCSSCLSKWTSSSGSIHYMFDGEQEPSSRSSAVASVFSAWSIQLGAARSRVSKQRQAVHFTQDRSYTAILLDCTKKWVCFIIITFSFFALNPLRP